MTGISEKPVSPDTLLSIKKCAKLAIKILGIEARQSTPSAIIAGIDQFVNQWQRRIRPDESILQADDAPLMIGSLWGQAIVTRFKWDWAMVVFREQGHARSPAVLEPAVVSPDRSLAIYPLHFLTDCFSDSAIDPAIGLSYNLLKSGSIRGESAGEYFNLMDRVNRLAPRS